MVFKLFSNARRAPVLNAIVAPTEVFAAEVPSTTDRTANFDQMLDLFEKDISRVVSSVAGDIERAKDGSIAASSELGSVKKSIGDLVEASTRVDSEIQGIATSADEMQSAAAEILANVEDVRSRSGETTASASRSAEEVQQLVQSINEIGTLLNSIDEISSRTNLLALNATIEAARAGEAGRGFAVVAQEVKALSVAAGQSVAVIRQRMNELQAAGNRAVVGMKKICTDVSELAPVTETIAQAAEEQRSTVVDLAHRMSDARAAVSSMREAVVDIDAKTLHAKTVSDDIAQLSQAIATEANGLTRRVSVLLRGAGVADRRTHERFPIDLAMRIHSLGETLPARTFDISEGGLLIRADEKLKLKVGATVEADISRIGVVKIKIVSLSPMGTHCAFDGLSGPVQEKIQAVIAEFLNEHGPLIDRAKAVAAEIEAVIKSEIESGQLRLADLFDTDYVLVPGSDPKQFTTRYLERFDAILPPILERALRLDPKMAFCIAADRNGYVPVHNQKVSHAQRKGERAWNIANCRNRRIFDDRTGLLAGRISKTHQIQTYNRDMGNGNMVPMKEINAPIVTDGRHWGGVRMAYML